MNDVYEDVVLPLPTPNSPLPVTSLQQAAL